MPEHVEVLGDVVLAEFTTKRPCKPQTEPTAHRSSASIEMGYGHGVHSNLPVPLGVTCRW